MNHSIWFLLVVWPHRTWWMKVTCCHGTEPSSREGWPSRPRLWPSHLHQLGCSYAYLNCQCGWNLSPSSPLLCCLILTQVRVIQGNRCVWVCGSHGNAVRSLRFKCLCNLLALTLAAKHKGGCQQLLLELFLQHRQLIVSGTWGDVWWGFVQKTQSV